MYQTIFSGGRRWKRKRRSRMRANSYGGRDGQDCPATATEEETVKAAMRQHQDGIVVDPNCFTWQRWQSTSLRDKEDDPPVDRDDDDSSSDDHIPATMMRRGPNLFQPSKDRDLIPHIKY
jgi:hypothetical protein